MRRRAFTVPAVVIALAALPVAADATHKPGHTPGQGGVDLTIAANPNTTVFQNATVISGRLRGPDNGGRTVALREDAHPFGTGDRQVATSVTNAQGIYSFTRRPAENTTYQVTLGTVRSERALVNVRIRMSLSAGDYTPRAGQLVRFSGRACPAHDGTTVRIQRRTSTGAFRTVRRTALRAATRCSTYSRRIRIYRDGIYRVTADDANHATGISRTRFLNAHR